MQTFPLVLLPAAVTCPCLFIHRRRLLPADVSKPVVVAGISPIPAPPGSTVRCPNTTPQSQSFLFRQSIPGLQPERAPHAFASSLLAQKNVPIGTVTSIQHINPTRRITMALYTVLIVDDEEEFRDMTTKRLSKRNLECESAPDGDTALEMIAKKNYDVVLLDVKMPGRDGIETLREIKRIAPMTEVVMLTGHASVESGINGIKYGAFDYLMKPIELDPLFEKLNAAYERKRTQQEKIEMAQIKKDMVRPG
jgi:CheY-like chemotaxis protein